MTTRKELVEALRARYREAAARDKVKILDEFAALTGYHRKHAIRLLRKSHPNEAPKRISHTTKAREALTVPGGEPRSGLRRAVEGIDPNAGGCDGAAWTPDRPGRQGGGSCRSAQRRSIAFSPMLVPTLTATRVAGRARHLAAFRCAPSPTGGTRAGFFEIDMVEHRRPQDRR